MTGGDGREYRHHAAATAVRLRLAEAGDTQPEPKSFDDAAAPLAVVVKDDTK
jgi:hypothetical protein